MTAKTFSSDFGYTDSVLRNKPIREHGEDLRRFPTYTIPEAATILGISAPTLWEWFSGSVSVLKASGSVGNLPLLSFQDVVEAYAVYLLRSQHNLSMQSIRRALRKLPTYTQAKHPLISENLKVFEDDLLLDCKARGKFGRHVINLSRDGQLVINHVVDIFADRVLKDFGGRVINLYPWREWKDDKHSRPVEVNPSVLSGRLVITGTRIPVSVVAGRSKRESADEIASDYGIPVDLVEKALVHFGIRKKAA